jgi:hypothetical protein
MSLRQLSIAGSYSVLEGKGKATMQGLLVFDSLAEALRAGFHVYDRTGNGYLVRTRTAGGWALALAKCKD